MTTFVFPGQGSQSQGMGADLFDQFPELVAKADAILGYSIQALCLTDVVQKLNDTQYTQPALYVVNALSYFSKNLKPDFVAGHSLGEYNALLAAEVFDFETGLKLVQKRGELMSQVTGGAMAVIIGMSVEVIKGLLAQHHLMKIAIANDNSYTQIVISGDRDEIAQAQVLCKEAGAMMVVPLKVSGAFHSPFMKSAQEKFAAYLSEFQFAVPVIPVIANINARPYQASEIQHNLVQQITEPVRWTETIDYLLKQGETEFEEVGPGKVLAGLVKRIKIGK